MQTIHIQESTGTPIQWLAALDDAFQHVYEWYVYDGAYSMAQFQQFLLAEALELFDYEDKSMQAAWRAWLSIKIPPLAEELFQANRDADTLRDENPEEA